MEYYCFCLMFNANTAKHKKHWAKTKNPLISKQKKNWNFYNFLFYFSHKYSVFWSVFFEMLRRVALGLGGRSSFLQLQAGKITANCKSCKEPVGVAFDIFKPTLRAFSLSTSRRDLMEFFDEKNNWGESNVRCGRSWKIDELRLKSNTDLHKLW